MRFIRFTNRLVIPLLVRRELLARKTLGNDPIPAARRADAPRIEGMPNRSASTQLLIADPTIGRLRPPFTLRTEDFRITAHELASRNSRQQHLPINLDRNRQLPHEVDRINGSPFIRPIEKRT
jgi:hypothetical protein